MNVFAEFQDRIGQILQGLIDNGQLPAGLDLSRFVVEPPRDPSHGDLATNAAMVYAKEAKPGFASPRE
ncbi:MAG: arginine--tRNA ligase, partial [Beijerinckiaceae bacterium]|nr:arginine--tRNA ligase [Beijerinckiaceae bacterium]